MAIAMYRTALALLEEKELEVVERSRHQSCSSITMDFSIGGLVYSDTAYIKSFLTVVHLQMMLRSITTAAVLGTQRRSLTFFRTPFVAS